jgi:hypothetical protein
MGGYSKPTHMKEISSSRFELLRVDKAKWGTLNPAAIELDANLLLLIIRLCTDKQW